MEYFFENPFNPFLFLWYAEIFKLKDEIPWVFSKLSPYFRPFSFLWAYYSIEPKPCNYIFIGFYDDGEMSLLLRRLCHICMLHCISTFRACHTRRNVEYRVPYSYGACHDCGFFWLSCELWDWMHGGKGMGVRYGRVDGLWSLGISLWRNMLGYVALVCVLYGEIMICLSWVIILICQYSIVIFLFTDSNFCF